MELIRTSERIESKYITNFLGLNKFIWEIRNAGFLKSYDVREVFSLYYDNEEFISINENLSGTTPRSKYRLRWYKKNDGNFNGFQFQKKVKTGITGFKEILLFDKETYFILSFFILALGLHTVISSTMFIIY